MLETLRLEDVTIELSIIPCDEGDVNIRPLGGNRCRVSSNEFAHLRIAVRNQSSHQLPLLLDVQPARDTQLDHVLFQGPHLHIPLGILQAGKEASTREHKIGLCFLASGDFGFVATVRHAGFNAAEIGATVRSETTEITVIV
ncbi:hypothetical protein FRC06_001701 [Ceratobasidium sp. 370]|nr:hypothetical protein FRC06_001701 [Ceratobasidium sp. 370]